MFTGFDPGLFADPEFKEDSVREVVILPILSRLGYRPTGKHSVTRSKTLVQPFIYVGTRQHPVTIVPDYTMLVDGRPVLILDAKRPTESIMTKANVQQAYSYAIHPEIRAKHFALCNGKELAVFSVDAHEPLLHIAFEHFESRWKDIERHLGPKYLLEPALRQFAPDFGACVSRLGAAPRDLILLGVRLNTFMRVSADLYSASVNTEIAGETHCASYDFSPEILPRIIAGLPDELAQIFVDALSRAPFQACADLHIEVDVRAHLGHPIEVEHETFVPLIIDEVLASRFNPEPVFPQPTDIPSHIFRLSKAFRLR